MNKTSSGFTIVELLIVIVVIAILAAVSIVAYNGIQDRANDSTVHMEASNAAKKIELSKVDLGRYPTSASEFDTGFKFTKSAYLTTSHNALYCVNRTTDQYALGLISKSSKGYIVSNGAISENVSVTPNSVCATVGTTWVSDAVTYTLHGYVVGSSTWATSWSWTSGT